MQEEGHLDRGSAAGSQETDRKVVIYSSCYERLCPSVQSKGGCHRGGGIPLSTGFTGSQKFCDDLIGLGPDLIKPGAGDGGVLWELR